MIRLHNVDIFKNLDNIVPDESIDLVAVDPPYLIGYGNNVWDKHDFVDFTERWVEIVMKKLKPTGQMWAFMAKDNCFTWSGCEKGFVNILEKYGTIHMDNWVTWARQKGRGSSKHLKSQREELFHFTKHPTDFTWNNLKMLREVIVPYVKDGRPRGWFLDEFGKRVRWTGLGNVWTYSAPQFNGVAEKQVHPSQKPVMMMERIIRLSSNEGDTILDPFMGCYDSKTEILTYTGWKLFSELKETDCVITRDNFGNISYQLPTQHFKYKYDGNMIKIKSRSTDLLVTPNHNMYVLSHADFNSKKFPNFVKAEELKLQQYRIPIGGNFVSVNDDIPEEIMYLIGLYVSEGYIEKGRAKNRIVICQNKGKKWSQMWKWVEKLNPSIRSNRKFSIKLNDYWFNFIKENCGESKYHKFLSPVILNNKYLNSLFDAMMLGDGYNKGNCRQYYTVSEKLKNSFEELCLKLGYETSVNSRLKDGGILRGRKIKATTPCYTINIRKSNNKKIFPNKHISEIKYNDYVYCVEVPNHVLYVKRNGKSTWCGNSGTTGIACKLSNRSFKGFENDPKMYQIASKRILEDFDIIDYPGFNLSKDLEILNDERPKTKKQIAHIKNNIPEKIKTTYSQRKFF